MNAQEFVADGFRQSVDARGECQLHLLEENLPRERVAVGMQAIRRQTEHNVSRPDRAAIEHLPAVNHADDRTGEVVLTALVHARHLGSLAADERAARGLARAGEASDELLEYLGFQPLRANVVEEK